MRLVDSVVLDPLPDEWTANKGDIEATMVKRGRGKVALRAHQGPERGPWSRAGLPRPARPLPRHGPSEPLLQPVTKADLEQALAPLRTDPTALEGMIGMLPAGAMSRILKGFF